MKYFKHPEITKDNAADSLASISSSQRKLPPAIFVPDLSLPPLLQENTKIQLKTISASNSFSFPPSKGNHHPEAGRESSHLYYTGFF